MITLNPKFSLADFFKLLSSNKNSMLILDYDGTLSPFSNNPATAYPYPGVFDRLIELMKMQMTKVVIISGREIESLKKLIPSPTPELWGSHGGERLMENSTYIYRMPAELKNRQILEKAAKIAGDLAPQLYAEIKSHSVALHWRGKDAKLAEPVKARWIDLIIDQQLEIQSFDQGIELKILGIDKGQAVKKILEEFPEKKIIAYLGDDLADENAFQILQDKALKVLVRNELRPTLADIYIKPPEELLNFLDNWLEVIKGSTDGRKN